MLLLLPQLFIESFFKGICPPRTRKSCSKTKYLLFIYINFIMTTYTQFVNTFLNMKNHTFNLVAQLSLNDFRMLLV